MVRKSTKTSTKVTKKASKPTKSTKKSTKKPEIRVGFIKQEVEAKKSVLAEVKKKPEISSKTLDDCNSCRWKRRTQDEKECPPTGIQVDFKKPIQNCDNFRKFDGEYY